MAEREALSKAEFTRLAGIQVLILVASLAVFGATAHYFFNRMYLDSVRGNITAYLESLYHQLPKEIDQNWCHHVAESTDLRLTVISITDGRALCDSVFDPVRVPTLLDRPEVQDALGSVTSHGMSVRFSRTLRDASYYGA